MVELWRVSVTASEVPAKHVADRLYEVKLKTLRYGQGDLWIPTGDNVTLTSTPVLATRSMEDAGKN